MKIYVAGHRGMVGSAIMRRLQTRIEAGEEIEVVTRTHAELNLINQQETADFMAAEKPDVVIMAAAKVGGIYANNTYPAEFIYQNMMMECNIIHQSYAVGVDRLLFLGSSCIYPRVCEQPISEHALMTGEMEPTNEAYAIAKIAGIKLCEAYNRQYGVNYRSLMPTNLYGPEDNFHPKNSHVMPALIRRFHEAALNDTPEVEVWGSGNSFREFLHVDDMAEASLHVLELDDETYKAHTQETLSHINAGTGQDVRIRDLAFLVAKVTGFKGKINFDASKPEGAPRKLMDVSRLKKMGWSAKISLEDGVEHTFQWYLKNSDNLRGLD